MTYPALERCVGDVEDFLRTFWGRAPLLRRAHEDGQGFDDLASYDDLDHIVSSLGLSGSSLRMVRDGTTLSPKEYTVPPAPRSRALDAQVSPAAVYERFSAGATIVLEGLHRLWQPLTDFCRDLELALGHRLQVNAYITPAGSQGFDVHRDDHDVFVLQVWGSKHWVVYDRDDDARVLIDEDIDRGAALYIPKGFPHAAKTSASVSAHLTVGIVTHESIEVVRALAKLAEEEPMFEARLRAEDARDVHELRQTVEQHLDDVRMWLDKVDVDELTNRVARRVMSTSQPLLRGQLRQLELLASLDDSTLLRRRRGVTCRLFARDDQLRVLLPDRELAMPSFLHSAMTEVARRETLEVRELHRFLDPADALVLVRRLVREGVLEVVVAG